MLPESSTGAQSPSPTSTLSSLTPSPDRPPSGSPSRKRPRLSSTSPPPARLSTVPSPAAPEKAQAFDDLLEGLGEDDFRLPPSSNPVIEREDGDEEDGEPVAGLPVVAEGMEEVEGAAETPRKADAGAADDSGVGLLPDIEQVKAAAPSAAVEGEPPDGDDLEFDGDDLWLEFDEADVGFDQPSALPSSMLSAATAAPARRDKGKGVAREMDVETDDSAATSSKKEEPRLHDFGFTGLGGAQIQLGGGFVFATRKPFAVSEQAMQRARALLEAEDQPAEAKSRQNSMPPPPTRTSTPVARPPFPRPPPPVVSTPRAASPAPRLASNLPPPSTLSAFGGFQTAAGSSVSLPSADALARAQKSLQGSSSPARPFDPTSPAASTSTSRPPLLAPLPPPAPPPAPAFLGFQNAAGRALDMPSEEAMRRAQEQLDARSSSPVAGPSRAPRPPSRPPSRVPSRSGETDVFAGGVAPADAAKSGSKFALLPPVARLAGLGGVVPDSPTTARVRMSSSERDGEGGGSSGRRTPLAPVDANAALACGEKDSEEEGASTATLRSSSPPALPNAPPPSLDAAPPPAAAFAPLPPLPSTAPPVQTPLIAPVPLRPAPVASTSAFASASRPPSTALPASTRSLAFRSPFASSHTSTPSRGPSASFTPLRPSSLAPTITLPSASSTPNPNSNPLLPGPPGTQRRLNLGMTPRSKPFHLANTRVGTPRALASGVHAAPGGVGPRTGVKAFKTPFKGGKAPEGLTPQGLKGKMEDVGVKGSDKKAASAKKGKGRAGVVALDPKREKAKVFELDATGVERFDLLTFGMRPQTHYYEHLQTLRVPPEILDMDPSSGLSYVFPCGSSVQTAFTTLQELVAARMPDEKDLVTLPWVKNHWALVLWKLASYVRSRPDLVEEWWTFERVMEQLRYRYEREINLAQRSCIKRIQEHDSPSTLPMILCVTQIRWDEPADADSSATSTTTSGDAPLVIVGLELTDGWYRIRSNVDQTLKSACERGKIVVGSKIAVMGAKLESSKNEGMDVLQALSRSSLTLSGNSTCLAPWHATLGFHRDPFVSSLSRLSSKGGLVPLVDVVVERAYPCGYIDLRKGRGTETWGEEEELVRAEEWKRGRKKLEAKLADEAEKAGVEEDEVVELLQEAAERIEPSSARASTSAPSEEPDEILDRLDSASSKAPLIRKLSPQQIRACLALALENAQASRFRVVEDLQKELAEKYPPRDVRGFRVIRIRDAQIGEKTSNRTALLTIWDVQSFEEGFVKEGGRYLISNTVPKGSWRHGDLEISLATRRDSRWRKV
ncbi:hypothetical protein JCM6882_005258 [Rhodosporidiobolus microsporus]